ncbi:PaaI family thioesterase [Neobacillus mesonae]|uniref:PaaI family thioesterase n=1 Tax=Neobacillus mesonae TaxID=1193713 RepID=UPI0020421DAE|nr:PaaI family thioesterase [Neobacillus mesonae]MCM3568780.1 PaaI family thioesterase [Neobacillus mesonae]
MKEELRQLLNQCIENGSETELNAIKFLLEGIKDKMDHHSIPFLGKLLHMEIISDKDCCEITIPLNPVVNNNLEILHGGITATVLDTVMGTLANTRLPEGFAAVTNQLNIHYISPGIGDSLRCKAELIHQGSKTFVITGEAYRSDGKKIAHATGTFFIVPKK